MLFYWLLTAGGVSAGAQHCDHFLPYTGASILKVEGFFLLQDEKLKRKGPTGVAMLMEFLFRQTPVDGISWISCFQKERKTPTQRRSGVTAGKNEAAVGAGEFGNGAVRQSARACARIKPSVVWMSYGPVGADKGCCHSSLVSGSRRKA